ncbi:hypothetical protein [Phenylobacterium immobile]|uniref:hypothetical protein n=1 Tax=Phenylobacterium immobile TaxID=21 RepID=UPI0011467BCE|nr:hypothetical protein [Phenylobacterium immobile]
MKAFLDANVVLEGRDLHELPWAELHADGPILALITPKAMDEIDAKKRDGRLGKHARTFNRLIASSISSGLTIVVREASPRVELCLAVCDRIPWDDYDELDPDDGDARIVAETLHARGVAHAEKRLVSHDIKPLAFAAGRGLMTHHISDDWLRPPEPSPADKEIQRLKQQVRELKSTEPEISIDIEVDSERPVRLHRLEPLSPEATAAAIALVRRETKRPSRQSQWGLGVDYFNHDSSFDERFDEYVNKTIPEFFANYADRLQGAFNQLSFSVRVINVGAIRADHVVVELRASGGWLHDKFVFISPSGPQAPQPRGPLAGMTTIRDLISPHVGRHEFAFSDPSARGRRMTANCADFRHGQTWTFDGVMALDVDHPGPAELSVRVTAANLHGECSKVERLELVATPGQVSEFVDLGALKFVASPLSDDVRRALDEKKIRWEIEGFEDDD